MKSMQFLINPLAHVFMQIHVYIHGSQFTVAQINNIQCGQFRKRMG